MLKKSHVFSKSQLLKTHMPNLYGQDIEKKRSELLSYFQKTFFLDETLYECVKEDKYFLQKGSPLRHPIIFYFGHTAVFYINKLYVAGLIPHRINEQFESIFSIGVDEMSWDDLNESNYDWPSVDEVRSYRAEVKKIVENFIQSTPLTLPITWDSPFWVLNMAIEHQRIHLETSSVLIRELPISSVQSHPFFETCPHTGTAPTNEFINVTSEKITLGKPFENPYYGWDNEYGEYTQDVKAFKASKYLVSNKEFFEFMEDKGYQTSSYWEKEGWAWNTYQKATHPHFWIKREGQFYYRTLTTEIEMPWDWPADLNYHECKAFCNWKSKKLGQTVRMPTESEWTRLRNLITVDQPTWEEAPGNINLEKWSSSCPVNMFEQSRGFHDIIGNVWQWTETPIAPLPGFKVHPIYDDFSVPTFDQQHHLIKGGSFFSTGNYALKDSRYAFRKHFFQHAGLRYIATEAPIEIAETNPYETDSVINQYLEFQYGDEYFNTPNFAQACAKISLKHTEQKDRALDLGCAVGRLSYELAREFKHVDGVDFSARFIACAVELQKNDLKKYKVPTEGDLVELKEARLSSLNLKEHRERCHFKQGDACNLDPKYNSYDLIFAGNLIDRLYSPTQFLQEIPTRLKPNGTLVITSPYTWLEEYTNKSEWLGGFKKNGENFTSLDGLKSILLKEFELVETKDVPFVIRETSRKFQHTLAQLSIWKKRK